MAKHVANLGKGSTPPNHVGRETVPQDMGANVARWWLQLGPLESGAGAARARRSSGLRRHPIRTPTQLDSHYEEWAGCRGAAPSTFNRNRIG
jgi:hypothetical protein